ncbi:MAG: hypothetical protein LQ341_007542 [Variospora aurantia]|nr:MAG: hypothetical protein LQ341_007542 [Variospora aurantia]
MDPVSAVASVVALVGVTLKTVKYVNDMKDVSKERQSLSQESADLLQMLTRLRKMIEDPRRSTISLDGITRLLAAKGPLDQLREALEQLNKKVKAKRGVQKYARMLVWPYVKEHCKDILDRMERVKSLISLALNGETYELLRALADNNNELLHAIQTDTAAGIDTIKKGVAGLQVRVDERRRILDWLSPLNSFKTQQDILARREGDTGQWIIDSPDFCDWFAGSDRTLCCVGIPGAGKSVLASIVVDFLRNTATSDRRRAVAAVYCNFKETTVQSPENLLGSLCIQALHEDVPIPTVLQELYKSHEAKQTRPTLEDFNRVFVEIGKLFDDLYLVIDALDECSADARSFLTQKLKSLSPNSRLLVTTRPIDDITQRFTSGRVVEIRASDGDLEKYIKAKLQSSSRLSTLFQGQHTLEKEMSDRIITKANGM